MTRVASNHVPDIEPVQQGGSMSDSWFDRDRARGYCSPWPTRLFRRLYPK